MAKHMHYDHIVAWATGAEIQWKWPSWEQWATVKSPNPDWNPNKDYRVKPRMFSIGSYYPLVDMEGNEYMGHWTGLDFAFEGSLSTPDNFIFIGEPIPDSAWEV